MQPSNQAPSLQRMCLQAVVNECNQKEILIQQDERMKSCLPAEIFLSLKNLQTECVTLKVYSWTEHELCLYAEDSYSLHECFSSLKNKIQQAKGLIIRTFQVHDHEWNAKHTHPMWKTVQYPNQRLLDYGYNAAGEKVTIFAEISSLL
ncbi:MAG: hypothetical protein ACSNEK_08590 [Parachlamydiaceae bacterium]